MIGDAPGKLHLRQPPYCQCRIGEVEVAALGVLQREGWQAVPAREPRYLVIELVQFGLLRIAEDRARRILQVIREVKPRRDEGVVECVALAVDVEVAQGYEVMIPTIDIHGPLCEPLRYRPDLGYALLFVLPVEDMQLDKDEGLLS